LALVKDVASVIASTIAAITLCFSAYQFYLGRLAIQSQAIHEATKQAVQIHSAILNNPGLYSNIYGVQQENLIENIAIRQIFGLYVSIYYDREAGILPNGAWAAISKEICGFVNLPKVKPISDVAMAQKQYPEGFLEIVRACGRP